nr:GNAT family N-acetyltransferase [uncultured Clostridium sp.]
MIAIRLTDNKIIGVIDFRHHINHPILSVWGGHIGYSVRPDERKKGYAKEMLRQNLKNCKAFGLDKVLITCNYANIASEKTIIANGGVFEKEVYIDSNRLKRYWIQL